MIRVKVTSHFKFYFHGFIIERCQQLFILICYSSIHIKLLSFKYFVNRYT